MDALDSTQFTHDNPVYQVLAEQSNIQAEEALGFQS